MRTISELLTILRDNAGVYDNQIYDGLCWEAFELSSSDVISIDERHELHQYIKENMPYYKHIDFNGMVFYEYGWAPSEWPARLAWLNEHIELTKDQLQ